MTTGDDDGAADAAAAETGKPPPAAWTGEATGDAAKRGTPRSTISYSVNALLPPPREDETDRDDGVDPGAPLPPLLAPEEEDEVANGLLLSTSRARSTSTRQFIRVK
jgi:hypothetical protein